MERMKIKKIMVSQPKPAGERNPYKAMEEAYGVEFDFKQLIRVVGITPREFRDQRIHPEEYTAILFNSRTGIDHFFRLMSELRIQIKEEMHYYCISEAVGNYLQKYIQYRKRRVFFGANNTFEDVIPAMNRRPNERYLLACSDVHNDDVINMMAQHGISIKPMVCYRTETVAYTKEEMEKYDMYVLFTPTGVSAFRQNYPDYAQKQGNKVMACFGKATMKAIEEEGWRLDIAAPTPENPSITGAIDKFLAAQMEETEQDTLDNEQDTQINDSIQKD